MLYLLTLDMGAFGLLDRYMEECHVCLYVHMSFGMCGHLYVHQYVCTSIIRVMHQLVCLFLCQYYNECYCYCTSMSDCLRVSSDLVYVQTCQITCFQSYLKDGTSGGQPQRDNDIPSWKVLFVPLFRGISILTHRK